MPHEGGCLCGAVRYAVSGPLREILVCHCVDCRRWTGRAWAATAAENANLEVRGSKNLVWFTSPRSEHGASRASCGRCGSGLFWRPPGFERTSISAGTLDDVSGLSVAAHIWVEQATTWDRPLDGLPAHPRGYPAEAPPLAWS